MYPIYPEQVLDATTYEPNRALVGQQVQVVTRNTTTPYPIYDAAEDPIPSSLVTVTAAVSTPTFWIDTDTPETVYLDWYDAGSGQRGPIDFEEVLRQTMAAAHAEIAAARQEIQEYIAANPGGGSPGITVHNELSGLTDGDPHTQYLTPARGDARYDTKEISGSRIAAAVSTSSQGDRDRTNHFGTQPISSVTDLESRLQAAASSGGNQTIIAAGEDIPLGTPPGIIFRVPGDTVPTTDFEIVGYTSQDTTVTCAIPSAAAVGDAVVFIPAWDGAGTGITVTDTGWVELLDYSPQQGRKGGAYVYRIPDATALAALGETVTATMNATGRRMGAVFTLPGALVGPAWPAYGSGSNRSAATLNSTTTTGWVVQAFSTATVPFDRVVLFTIHDGTSAATADGFTEICHVTGSDAGSEPKTLTIFVKDLATTPVPAATVVHEESATNASGGGQFIIPVA